MGKSHAQQIKIKCGAHVVFGSERHHKQATWSLLVTEWLIILPLFMKLHQGKRLNY
jgi:hypothetical protein